MRILAIPFLIEASKRNQVASVQQGLFHFLFICEELKNVLVDIVVVVVNVTDVVIIVVDVDVDVAVAAVAVVVVNDSWSLSTILDVIYGDSPSPESPG